MRRSAKLSICHENGRPTSQYAVDQSRTSSGMAGKRWAACNHSSWRASAARSRRMWSCSQSTLTPSLCRASHPNSIRSGWKCCSWAVFIGKTARVIEQVGDCPADRVLGKPFLNLHFETKLLWHTVSLSRRFPNWRSHLRPFRPGLHVPPLKCPSQAVSPTGRERAGWQRPTGSCLWGRSSGATDWGLGRTARSQSEPARHAASCDKGRLAKVPMVDDIVVGVTAVPLHASENRTT